MMSLAHPVASSAAPHPRAARGTHATLNEHPQRPSWLSRRGDPFTDLLIDPAHQDSAYIFATSFYEHEKRSRRNHAIAIASTVLVTMLLLAASALTSAPVLGVLAGVVAVFVVDQIARAYQAERTHRRSAVRWMPWARSSHLLGGYLVTTPDAQRLWEAAGHQQMRDALQHEIVRLHSRRQGRILAPDRDMELQRLLDRDDELRATIVALCDPTERTI